MNQIHDLGNHQKTGDAELAAARLLRWLKVAVGACVLGVLVFYLNSAFNEEVSEYRRDMNTGAYSAQMYFDHVESLISLIARSSSGINADSASEEPGTQRLSVAVAAKDTPVTLALPASYLRALDELDANLVYMDAGVSDRLQVLYSGADLAPVSASTIVDGLIHRRKAPHSLVSPVYWVATEGEPHTILVFTKIEGRTNSQGWLGLQLSPHFVAGIAHGTREGDVMLLDGDGRIALGGYPGANDLLARVKAIDHDYFGFAGAWPPTQLVLSKSIGLDNWRLVYRVEVVSLVKRMTGRLLLAALIGAGLMLLAGWLLKLIDDTLIRPLRERQDEILENLAFTTTLIQMAPIGLSVVRASDHRVLLDNGLARAWLGNGQVPIGKWFDGPRARTATQGGRVGGDSVELVAVDGRQLQMLHVPARYRGDDVFVCAFTDISSHHQAQKALLGARQMADEANKAKSLFLATIGHEIRTPLYGITGTLELLDRTELNYQQSQYVDTIQQSSSVLLQLINDILEVSRIETGQLSVEPVVFSPLELTDSVVRSYADAAARKNLQILVCADATLPTRVFGDAAKVRQVLGNLLSNAIKFTDHGLVFLRAQLIRNEGDQATLHWQVTDTGIGISPHDQAQIFKPFWQGKSLQRQAGSGLGLPICHNLATLMSGHLEVASVAGVGSSFSLCLPFVVPSPGDWVDDEPKLRPRPLIYVRSSVAELAESVAAWLRRWGATVETYDPDFVIEGSHNAVLLDIAPKEQMSADWSGPWVVASAEGGAQPRVDDSQVTVTLYSVRAIAQAVSMAQGHAILEAATKRREDEALDMDLLVVEDNPINRLIIKEQLELLGCRVVLATNGNEALVALRNGSYDAMLTDINLPDMTGFELFARARAAGELLPVMGTTASANATDRKHCLELGMVSCLFKPIDMLQLKKSLRVIRQEVRHG